MWQQILLLHLLVLAQAQFDFDFPELPELPEFPDLTGLFSLFELLPTCSCEGSRCECCVTVPIFGQEGCLRVAVSNSRARVAFVFNGEELGGFSTRLSGVSTPGITVQLPCAPGVSAAVRVVRRRAAVKTGQRLCLNVSARTRRRNFYDQDFCFDFNGNALSAVTNG